MFGGVAYTLLYFMGWKRRATIGSISPYSHRAHDMRPAEPHYECLRPAAQGRYVRLPRVGERHQERGIVNAVSGYVNKLSSSIHAMLSGAVFDWIKFKPQHDAYGNIVPHTNRKSSRASGAYSASHLPQPASATASRSCSLTSTVSARSVCCLSLRSAARQESRHERRTYGR